MTYRVVYRVIKAMRGGREGVQRTIVPISKNDGTPCVSVDEVLERWNDYYQQMLNCAPASSCPELDAAAANAAPADDVRDDAPTLQEVQKAIRKLISDHMKIRKGSCKLERGRDHIIL